jgi:hypothetical protein
MSQNATVRQGFGFPVPDSDRTELTLNEAASQQPKPACVALVPIAQTERRLRRRWYRWAPDPIFVTHLIAAAQQAPQTRRLRQATPADAQAAYQSGPSPARDVGSRMRQVI